LDKLKYLERIGLRSIADVSDDALADLHKKHVFEIPFENLDVHFGQLFDLMIERIYQKVVCNGRGGFCYELNLLFNWLLNELGYSSRIVSCRIFNEQGERGPEYDHMAVYVDTGRKFLLDVGFGDLFVIPLEITNGAQSDGRNFFRIDPWEGNDYVLSMSADGVVYAKRYTFNLDNIKATDFDVICLDKQTNPNSYFVKNVICTKPTTKGRVTIFNDKLIERNGDLKIETSIPGSDALRWCLKNNFGITIL